VNLWWKQRNVNRRLGTGLAAAAVMALVLVSTAQANLPTSNFEGNDGNLIVNTPGNSDWINAPNRVTGVDRPSGGSDNSFGQGTKEDNAAVTVVTGSIPPNKSDLTRFYIANEFAGTSNFVYLAWERSNVLGSANMDFEINQKVTPGFGDSTTGPVTLARTAGDVLITFDFTNGGGSPVLGLLKWVTTGAASQCFSANSLPCWGNRVDLSAAGFAEGAVNTVPVIDPISGATLPGLTFGEAAVNLTAAGVFPPDACEAFGSAFVKSRSSASFPAEVKDFIAPQPVNISNCGTIIVHKITQNGDASFGYTTTGGLSPATFNLSNGQTQSYLGNVLPGNYSVNESTIPAEWTFVSLVCTSNGSGTSVSTNGTVASITMAPGGIVDCTYTNKTRVNPNIVTLLSAGTVNIGEPVHDSATLSGSTADAGGTVTYTVYSDSACMQVFASAGTKTVTNAVVPDSDPVSFPIAGTFYWQAVYSGDANNNGATSVCTSEILVVERRTPAMTTAQNLLPNDDATLSGATANAGGSITFSLFDPSAPTCSGSPAYTQTVAVNGNGTYSTTNTTFLASVQGTWRWVVNYTGDANNNPTTSACGVENFTIING
jgi:hypothetical protein